MSHGPLTTPRPLGDCGLRIADCGLNSLQFEIRNSKCAMEPVTQLLRFHYPWRRLTWSARIVRAVRESVRMMARPTTASHAARAITNSAKTRSEEHTSELQSQSNLVF